MPVSGGGRRSSRRRASTGAVAVTVGRIVMSAAVSDSRMRRLALLNMRSLKSTELVVFSLTGGRRMRSGLRAADRQQRQVQRLRARRAVPDVAVVRAQRDRLPGRLVRRAAEAVDHAAFVGRAGSGTTPAAFAMLTVPSCVGSVVDRHAVLQPLPDDLPDRGHLVAERQRRAAALRRETDCRWCARGRRS